MQIDKEASEDHQEIAAKAAFSGLRYVDGCYRSPAHQPSRFARTFPGLAFYRAFLGVVFRASRKAKRHRYDDSLWFQSSLECFRLLEGVGVRFEVSGIANMKRVRWPCVIIANHMSALETVVLPTMIMPYGRVTFIVKQSLLEYPVFRHVMRSRDPIAVSRTNPRADLKAVLEGGMERLAKGISIIVFPQTTRTHTLDPAQFSSIGVKLAQKAGVPVVPLALRTDAWGNGKRLKDFGRVDPALPVHFAFGEPIEVQTRRSEEHQQVIRFISGKLEEWRENCG